VAPAKPALEPPPGTRETESRSVAPAKPALEPPPGTRETEFQNIDGPERPYPQAPAAFASRNAGWAASRNHGGSSAR
jgi:hypothetical protein